MVRNTPLPLLPIVPPLIRTPFCSTTLAFCAAICPAALLMLVDNCRMPPLRASSTPLLVRLPEPPPGVMFSVAPPRSAEMRPLLTRTLVPPDDRGWPMLPCPRTTMLAPSVVVPLPSRARRAPGSLRLKLPVPTMLLAAPSVLSRLTMPPLAMFTLPLSVMPLPMRSRALTLVVTSSRPASVTPFRMLLPLLFATTAPVPAVLIVPPLIVLPNWLSRLPLAMLILPPLLLRVCPPKTPNEPVILLPTFMVPLLVLVWPAPTRLRLLVSMLIWPALFRFKADCAVLIVITPLAPLAALSAAPGTPAGLPLPARHDAQLIAAAQLPAVVFQAQFAAAAGSAVANNNPPKNKRGLSSVLAELRSTRRAGLFA